MSEKPAFVIQEPVIEKPKLNIRMMRVINRQQLDNIERKFRRESISQEFMPWADHTAYSEIAENIIKDRSGEWRIPLIFIITKHDTSSGISELCKKADEYLKREKDEKGPIDTLSIAGYLDEENIILNILVRPYINNFEFSGFFKYIGARIHEKTKEELEEESKPETGKLIIPDDVKNFKITDEMQKSHDSAWEKQKNKFDSCDKDHPFLNEIDSYTPKQIPNPLDKIDPIYDLASAQKKINTVSEYDNFMKVYREMINFVSGTQRYRYQEVMRGEQEEDQFMNMLEQHIYDEYVSAGIIYQEDVPKLLKMLYNACFKMYVLQGLIDDPKVTDIKITAPDSIRVRVYGKAYMSNVTFVDEHDYERFMEGIADRNHIITTVPEQTFTDKSDENYILRFTLTAKYVTSDEWPYLHIRKISRKKLLGDDLIKAGMFTPKIRDYLLDCARYSRGVVFAGPPGSGKTVALNWFLEEGYEQSAEILVIQENDELFAYRKGVMFQHVVNYYTDDGYAINLEQLGQLALVAGANVFIIGEAKGAEICSAITLSNSGCRTAITIHSDSSTQTIDKMTDLAMRGYAQDIDQAKRMLTSFQTVVYLKDFKVQEIAEITGYDEEKHDMKYRYIYDASKEGA